MKFKGIYFLYSLPVLLVFIWITVVYFPLSTKIKEKEKTITNFKKEMEILNSNIDSLVKSRNKSEILKRSIMESISEIPMIDHMPDFIKKLIKNSNKYGVVVVNFKNAFSNIDITTKTMLLSPAFEFTVKGRFMDIAYFLERLTENNAFKAIKKAELSYDEKEYPILTGRFLVEFKSLRRLPKFETK